MATSTWNRAAKTRNAPFFFSPTLPSRLIWTAVRTIPNDKWLPNNPALEVVITGGSSAVKPMREEVLNRTRTALCQRGLSEEFSYMTHLIEPKSDFHLNRAYRDIELAQLAVCLGASDPLLTELKSYAQVIN